MAERLYLDYLRNEFLQYSLDFFLNSNLCIHDFSIQSERKRKSEYLRHAMSSLSRAIDGSYELLNGTAKSGVENTCRADGIIRSDDINNIHMSTHPENRTIWQRRLHTKMHQLQLLQHQQQTQSKAVKQFSCCASCSDLSDITLRPSQHSSLVDETAFCLPLASGAHGNTDECSCIQKYPLLWYNLCSVENKTYGAQCTNDKKTNLSSTSSQVTFHPDAANLSSTSSQIILHQDAYSSVAPVEIDHNTPLQAEAGMSSKLSSCNFPNQDEHASWNNFNFCSPLPTPPKHIIGYDSSSKTLKASQAVSITSCNQSMRISTTSDLLRGTHIGGGKGWEGVSNKCMTLQATDSALRRLDKTDKKRHECPHAGCDKQFSTSGHARRHSRMHQRLRPFGCPHEGCRSTFKRRDNCTQHQRARHTFRLTPYRIGDDD